MTRTAALIVLAFAGCASPVVSVALLRGSPGNSTAGAKSGLVVDEALHIASGKFMEVKLGPFDDAAAACDYCFTSFTKEGVPPAGPVAPFCICMAYEDSGKYNMFCASPPAAAGFIGEKGGCTCVEKDMQALGKTTCTPIG
mmetsp:Transcript_90890/g.166485  ORF Transcript_90890/g.166485 Transcript_90890/m.166485 type:complete len:141 (+) Transcript_90890:87-509(+)